MISTAAFTWSIVQSSFVEIRTAILSCLWYRKQGSIAHHMSMWILLILYTFVGISLILITSKWFSYSASFYEQRLSFTCSSMLTSRFPGPSIETFLVDRDFLILFICIWCPLTDFFSSYMSYLHSWIPVCTLTHPTLKFFLGLSVFYSCNTFNRIFIIFFFSYSRLNVFMDHFLWIYKIWMYFIVNELYDVYFTY